MRVRRMFLLILLATLSLLSPHVFAQDADQLADELDRMLKREQTAARKPSWTACRRASGWGTHSFATVPAT